MSQPILTPILDIWKSAPSTDTSASFEQLWTILQAMDARIRQRFELQRDPCCAPFIDFQTAEGLTGNTEVYAGPEIDWYVYSWCGAPRLGFSNMHITLTLGPQSPVPNFGFALGTIPKLFLYMDYIPRVDPMLDMDYVDQYYREANEEFLRLHADPRLSPFVSRERYTRFAMTPTALAYSAEPEPSLIEEIRDLALQRLDRWLAWVDTAPATPLSLRPALAARDDQIRRQICERDPANEVVDQLYGAELGRRLVQTISAQNRSLPRPTAS